MLNCQFTNRNSMLNCIKGTALFCGVSLTVSVLKSQSFHGRPLTRIKQTMKNDMKMLIQKKMKISQPNDKINIYQSTNTHVHFVTE